MYLWYTLYSIAWTSFLALQNTNLQIVIIYIHSLSVFYGHSTSFNTVGKKDMRFCSKSALSTKSEYGTNFKETWKQTVLLKFKTNNMLEVNNRLNGKQRVCKAAWCQISHHSCLTLGFLNRHHLIRTIWDSSSDWKCGSRSVVVQHVFSGRLCPPWNMIH